ncbi:hypothetical protein EDB83DRAFT_2314762 [Lactarius deliciosus]|nr:hypothetical protein EDB83DRAFT_2314762 [Lactarius deliciosus]
MSPIIAKPSTKLRAPRRPARLAVRLQPSLNPRQLRSFGQRRGNAARHRKRFATQWCRLGLTQTQRSFQQISHTSVNFQKNQNATITTHSRLPPPSDTPAEAGEPNQSLPPHEFRRTIRSTLSPSAIACWPFFHQSGIPEGSELPSTSETRFPLPLISRAALPISHSMQWSERHHHDSAFRLTVIEDHQLALAQTIAGYLLLVNRLSLVLMRFSSGFIAVTGTRAQLPSVNTSTANTIDPLRTAAYQHRQAEIGVFLDGTQATRRLSQVTFDCNMGTVFTMRR